MRRGWFLPSRPRSAAFLYLPIISLVIFSPNESRLVTVWSGFSTKWYGELFSDPQMLGAAWLSVRSRSSGQHRARPRHAVRRGARALQALCGRTARRRRLRAARHARRHYRPALLLLFAIIDARLGGRRGILTIIIAHTTFCMAYVTVVVQSRLSDLDLSLEEAAMDLGATPARVFFDITLPIIAPALISGWLLAFTLSLDDLVIASFVSGPGSSTLPMVIFSKIRLGVSPDVNALATIIIGIVALGVFTATMLQLRRPRRA